VSLLCFATLQKLSANMPEIPRFEPTPGIAAGQTILHGVFGDFYKASPEFALRAYMPIGVENLFLMPEARYGSFALKTAAASRLTSYSFFMPIGAYLPLFRGISPFLAVGPEFGYFTVIASASAQEVSTYRVRPAARAGIFIPVTYFAFLDISVQSSYTQLSQESFVATTFSAGITVSYPAWRRNEEAVSRALEEQSRQQKIQGEVDALERQGKALLAEDKFDEAEQKFREILALKPGDKEARRHVDAARAMPLLREARAYREEGKGLSAIRSYEKAAAALDEARTELAEYRQQLKPSVPALSQSAVQAYDAAQYANAILILEKILAIDPENETAKLYLPRARNRQRAVEKLR
jgi:tetratricopeptide (TPR) repeat protein